MNTSETNFVKQYKPGSLPRIVELQEPAAELRIENVQLFDSVAGRMEADQTVIVRGDRIAWVGASDDPAIPAGDPAATRVDGRGKTLLPGLIDAHIHAGSDGNPMWRAAVPDQQRCLDAALYAGVTSVFNLGGPIGDSPELRESLRSGERDGPDVYIAVGQFTSVDGYMIDLLKEVVPSFLRQTVINDTLFQADTVADLEDHLARWKAADPDVMKIMIENFPPDAPVINDEVLRHAVAEGHAFGVPVVAHVSKPDLAMRALDAGVDGLAHLPGEVELTDEQISQMVESGIYVMTTIKILERFVEVYLPDKEVELTEMAREVLDPGVVEALQQPPPDDFEWPEVWGLMLDGMATTMASEDADLLHRNLRRLQEAGVKIVVATDSGAAPGWGQGYTLHEELEAVVAAGLPATAALQGATIEAARLMQIDEVAGSIETGKQADLLLLSADPITDIRNTTQIEAVYTRGRLVRRLP